MEGEEWLGLVVVMAILGVISIVASILSTGSKKADLALVRWTASIVAVCLWAWMVVSEDTPDYFLVLAPLVTIAAAIAWIFK